MTLKQIINSIFGVFRATMARDLIVSSPTIDNSDWEAKELDDEDKNLEPDDDGWGDDDDDDDDDDD